MGKKVNQDEPHHEKTNIVYPTRSKTNRPVHIQKMARGLNLNFVFRK